MVAYNVFRVQKLSTPGAIHGAFTHNARVKPTPNADPDRGVRVLVDGGPDLAATVRARIAAAGAKVRSDSVLAVEAVLSASPEYFRPDKPEAAGVWDKDRTLAWAKAHWAWAKKEFGDRIVDARLHLDEATPHIQFIFVPLMNNRLSAFDVVGREELRRMQTESAKAVEHLGIHRGLLGSKATHTRLKEYYAEVNGPAPKEPSPVRKRKVDVPPPMVRESVRIAWADGQNIAAKSVLDQERSRYTSEIEPHLNRSKAVDRLKKEAAAAKSTAAAAVARADDAENAARKALERAEAAEARDIPLDRVMALYGLEIGENGRFEGEGRSIRVEGSKWFDDGLKQASGRGAIDLVKHLRGLDFKDSVAWLKSNFDQTKTVDAIIVDAKVKAIDLVSTIDQPKPFVQPEPVPENWPKVRRWLTNVRRLAVDLVDWLHSLGRIYADEKANAVFIMTDQRGRPVGAELKGTGSTPFTGMAAGTSRNAGAFTIPPLGGGSASAVVLVESAIDAMSYIQIHSSSSGIEVKSTGGVRSQIPWLSPDRGDVVVAFDADSVGDKAAAALLAGLPPAVRGRRDRPAGGKDWNDLVKSGSGLPPSSDDLDIDRPRPLAAPVPAPRRQSDDPEPDLS